METSNVLGAVLARLTSDPHQAAELQKVLTELPDHPRGEVSKLIARFGSQTDLAALCNPQMTVDNGDYRGVISEQGNGNGHHDLKTWHDLDEILAPISWAWNGWLPNAMLTILAGESGAGKSALALRLAACFLKGENWPDGTPFEGETGAILWCEAEAAQSINLERARNWGLPLEKIYTPLENAIDDFSLDNNQHYAELINKAMLPEVKFIVIDSLSGAKPTAEKSTEDAIPTLKNLAAIARDTIKPMTLTHHLRKRGLIDTGEINIERVRGSSSIIQNARLVWGLDTPDPQTKDWKRLQVMKSNLAKFPSPIGLMINEAGVKFGLAPETPKPFSVTDSAIDLLRAILEEGPKPFDEIEEEYKAMGISERTIRRAKTKLGIVSKKVGGNWTWGLPELRNYIDD